MTDLDRMAVDRRQLDAVAVDADGVEVDVRERPAVHDELGGSDGCFRRFAVETAGIRLRQTFVPHSAQNFAPSFISAPHSAQNPDLVSFSPHSGQNFPPSTLAPHEPHVTFARLARSRSWVQSTSRTFCCTC